MKQIYSVKISFIQKQDENEKIKNIFGVEHFQKLSVVRSDDKTVFNVSIVTENKFDSETIDKILKNNDFILSIERNDD